MKRYEFRINFFDRVELRAADSPALTTLNVLGAEGWHIVHVRDDAQHARDLAVYLEREVTA